MLFVALFTCVRRVLFFAVLLFLSDFAEKGVETCGFAFAN
jgi:hypothetical protein